MTEVVGRYAPSPTGDQHLGNLRTALLAWLHARLQGGRFIVRMEDLDRPREVAGSADRILADLEWLGLDWDGPVVYQSQRDALYQAAFDALLAQELIYPCFCSRKDIANALSAPHLPAGIYPQTCRGLTAAQIESKKADKTPSWRLKVDDKPIVFTDGYMGKTRQVLSEEVGDFVVQRADGLFAYQLAVIVDDLDQGITDVVRGDDLLSSTARQIYIATKLGADKTQIRFHHVPLMFDQAGDRMSKRFGSTTGAQWRESGRSAEQLVAYLMSGLDLHDANQAISANELKQLLTLPQLMTKLSHSKVSE